MHEPLLATKKKSGKDLQKLTNVVNDENMLQLMERNITSTTTYSHKVIPSNRELNELVTNTKL